MASVAPIIHSNWYYQFDKLNISSDDFYKSVEKVIKDRKVPDMSVSRVKLSEGGLLSSNREYLRISRKNLVFDICAAPFGTSFFISWWLGENVSFLAELLSMIPFIGSYLVKRAKSKTYYQLDTENMFREGVNSCVMEVVDAITTDKGLRALSQEERKAVTLIR